MKTSLVFKETTTSELPFVAAFAEQPIIPKDKGNPAVWNWTQVATYTTESGPNNSQDDGQVLDSTD